MGTVSYTHLEELEAAFQPNTKLVFGETIANPALAVLDIERFAKAAHDHGEMCIRDRSSFLYGRTSRS